MPEIRNCVVLHGPELEPRMARRFAWESDGITAIDLGEPCTSLDHGSLVIIPGLYNGHTHMGDSALPDGATGLTLEEGFFRPDGYKYRELSKLSESTHLPHVVAHLRYMARTGTVCHIDFREQGRLGAELLRKASRETAVRSIILGQLNQVPFAEHELNENQAPLGAQSLEELDRLLEVADGFSESTMNDLTDAAWVQIAARTRAATKIRAIHCLENSGYRDVSRMRTGLGDLERALALYDPDLVIHMTVASHDEITLLAHSGKSAVLNPRANATLGLPLPPIAALLKSGVNLLLGTDNGMLNSPSMLAEMDFTYRVAKSQFEDSTRPDPTEILKMATVNVRPVLGADHYGYLATGMPASFVVLNFLQPHLRATRNLVASIVTRVTPDDVLATFGWGQELWRSKSFTC
jgi:5-methylthioadenosine/S-adenosylhomocysteine deaminase